MVRATITRPPQERYERAVWLLEEAGYQVQPRVGADVVVFEVRCGPRVIFSGLTLAGLVALARREYGNAWVQRARGDPRCVRGSDTVG